MARAFRRLYPYTDEHATRSCWEIWVNRQVLEFARTLDSKVYWRLRTLLVRTADEGKIRNREMYRSIDDGFYEFKADTTRLYSFDDGRRIVLTHGDKKRSDRAAEERKVAGRIKNEYFQWKGNKK